MENNYTRLRELFRLYIDNKLSPQQDAEFWELLSQADTNALHEELARLWHNTTPDDEQATVPEWDIKMSELKKLLDSAGNKKQAPDKLVVAVIKYWWAAAAILLGIIVTLYFSTGDSREDWLSQHEMQSEFVADVAPGSDKAVLTLTNGTQVILDSTNNGVVCQQGGTTVFKKDGQLVYSPDKATQAETSFNMLSIPRGGQYQLTLVDGTKIWLNSASTLLFPTVFNGNNRKVTITGEAYFEVAKDAVRPFLVTVNTNAGDSNKLTIEVLGTHFNINAYADEEMVKTTLLEGSIKLNHKNFSKLLKPGQQAQFDKSRTVKVMNDVDLDETIAWKEGNFQFEDTDIESVMRQLARWYDIQVEYKGKINKHFGGTISRNVNLSKVLNLLENTGEVTFSIEGNKVLIAP
jgi:Fe2+-dicitrate sensor, membrane component